MLRLSIRVANNFGCKYLLSREVQNKLTLIHEI